MNKEQKIILEERLNYLKSQRVMHVIGGILCGISAIGLVLSYYFLVLLMIGLIFTIGTSKTKKEISEIEYKLAGKK